MIASPQPHSHEKMMSWFFDCDGVLLDSNAAKTRAFAAVVAEYGNDAADQLVAHHVRNAGVSRFEKFEWFFPNVLMRQPRPGEIEELIRRFGQQCSRELQGCQPEPHAADLLARLAGAGRQVHVVSGGLETEVTASLTVHGLARHFTSVNGSPRTKAQILSDLGHLNPEGVHGVFVGDSRHDMEVAAEFGLRRVFVSQWSDFADWRLYVAANDDILVVNDLQQLGALVESVDSGL